MLTYLTAGESHGPQLTAILDGLPAGLKIDLEQVNFELARRQKGYGRGARMKIEQDKAQFVGGVRHGFTTGAPVAIVIANRDWENWKELMDPFAPPPKSLNLRQRRLVEHVVRPRPGHADLAGGIKWYHHDLRNVLERASARETAARTALGAVARQLLKHFGIEIASQVVAIGGVKMSARKTPELSVLLKQTEASEVRCPDKAASEKMIDAIRTAKKKSDSLGGIVEVIVRGLPAGLGGLAQWSDRLDGRLASTLMSLHSVKGVEIGLGFAAAETRGSKMQDEIFYKQAGAPTRKKGFFRRTNNAGGLEGGITNGEDLIMRVAAKPLSTLTRPLRTVNVRTKKPEEAMVERTDNCVVPALGVVCEAVTALVLADAFMHKFGHDNMAEIDRNFEMYLKTKY